MRESGEMYLENILVLSRQSEYVRAIDVVELMGFSKASVSRALSKLKQNGFITISGTGHISLNPSGREIAEKILERHELLSKMLIRLGVDEATAREDACKIEHDISDASFAAIKAHFAQHEA